MFEIQKAVIRRNGTYLVLLRAPTAAYFPNCWDFPGGKCEDDEDPHDAVEREVREETSLQVRAERVAGVFEFDLDHVGHPTHRFTLHDVRLLNDGEVSLSSEHRAYAWATEDEVLRLQTEPYISRYFGR
ncbi:NUDIX domain-containing protein [Candidatus Uhrbacteria bacterium]|nr:NUDIX domain-containing protein [Candidatus Uhrbacteria bacterium]